MESVIKQMIGFYAVSPCAGMRDLCLLAMTIRNVTWTLKRLRLHGLVISSYKRFL